MRQRISADARIEVAQLPWWGYVLFLMAVVLAIWGFISLVGFRTDFLTRKTYRTAEDLCLTTPTPRASSAGMRANTAVSGTITRTRLAVPRAPRLSSRSGAYPAGVHSPPTPGPTDSPARQGARGYGQPIPAMRCRTRIARFRRSSVAHKDPVTAAYRWALGAGGYEVKGGG